MIGKLALREIRHSGRRLRAAVLVLALGFAGPLVSSALRSSVDDYLQERSREILSADLAVTSFRPLKAEERSILEKELSPRKVTQETEFVTMGRGRDVTTLIEINGVDPTFPVFGMFRLNGGEEIASAERLNEEKIAWVFPEALAQLGLKRGDAIGIGKAEFRIEAVLDDAPGLSRAGGFAPRVYIGRRFVEETGLTQFGSQVFHRTYFELPVALSSEAAAEKVKAAIPDPDVFLRTPDDSTQGFERFFKFFNLFLVSVSMIVFALSWVSAFYILEVFIQERLKNAAILLTVGASRAKAGLLYALQLFCVQALGLAIATAVVIGGIALLPLLAGELLPRGFQLRLSWRDFASLLGVAIISTLAFSGPLFVSLFSLRLQSLLSENPLGAGQAPRRARLLAYIPMIFVFIGLSAWLTGSVKSALQLSGGLIAATLIGWFGGRALFKAFFGLMRRRPGRMRLVATNLARARFGVSLCFLVLLLVSIAFNLVPHLLNSALEELRPLQGGREVPALFLFNIPESEVERLDALARAQGAELRFLSPMILARLTGVNGKPPVSDQFQRFPVRLSYREKPIPSEVIVEGRDFSGRFDPSSTEIPEVSVETRYAERNGFRIGDELEFDVQGVPVQARVTSLRSVRWTEFNPNFFMVFQPGVLDDAPKTYLANVNLPGEGAAREEKKLRLQYELVKEFPDLSVIDIGRAIQRVLEVAASVIGPLKAAAGVAAAICFLILSGVIAHNLRLRNTEVDIEKMMGAESSVIRMIIVSEYAAIAAFAGVFGSLVAALLAVTITKGVLDIAPAFAWGASLASTAVIIVTTGVIAFVSCSRVLELRGASRKL